MACLVHVFEAAVFCYEIVTFQWLRESVASARMTSMKLTASFAVILLSCALSWASIDLGYEVAVANATVQEAGNRSGGAGTNFFNIQNNFNPAQFASYGVAEWDLGAGTFLAAPSALTFSDILSLSVRLTQSNAAFSRDTTLRFYLWDNNTPSLAPGDSDITYDYSELGGISNPLQAWFNTPNNLWEIGTGAYVESSSGDQDVSTFDATTWPTAARTYVADQLNNDGAIRIVVESTRFDDTGTATYAGNTNNSYSGPELSMTVIPEPGTWALVVTGLAFLLWRKNRRTA